MKVCSTYRLISMQIKLTFMFFQVLFALRLVLKQETRFETLVLKAQGNSETHFYSLAKLTNQF